MSWILIKVVSDLLASGNMVVAKEMLSHYVFDRRLYLLCVALVSIPFAIFGVFYLVTLFSPFNTLVCLLVGISYIISGYFYYQAISAEEPFRVSLILRLGSVFTLILSVVLLKESLKVTQEVGFWVALLGGLVLAAERVKRANRLDRGICSALLSALAGAISSTLTVYLLQRYTLWQTFAMTRVGVVLGTLILLELKGTLNTGTVLLGLRLSYRSVLAGEQLIRLVSLFLQTIAIAQIGSAALVAVLSGFMPLYVGVMASVLGQEKVRKQKLRGRFIAFSMLLLGSFLMTR